VRGPFAVHVPARRAAARRATPTPHRRSQELSEQSVCEGGWEGHHF
jgi:hypothetical protein